MWSGITDVTGVANRWCIDERCIATASRKQEAVGERKPPPRQAI